jgi:uncharacterized protein (DUF1684 family)
MIIRLRRYYQLLIIFLGINFFCLFFNCQSGEDEDKVKKEYITSIEEWHRLRIEGLKKPDGWLSLAGLYWLEPGENRFGSDSTNDIIFPPHKAAPRMGELLLSTDKITLSVEPGIKIFFQGKPVTHLQLKSDETTDPTILEYGSLSWYVIKRGEEYLVRLKDSSNPLIEKFKGLEYYPVDLNWRLKSKFEYYQPPKVVPIPNVLGKIDSQPSPGSLIFEIEGKEYRLDVVGEPQDLRFFVIFADLTNGWETYGAGRFLYVDRPGENGLTWIDLNQAYNPPCAFTPYATCPLPPEQNYLPVKISAGEKKYNHNGH